MAEKQSPHIGVHLGGHSVFEEGAERVVETLSRTCHATHLHCYAMSGHTYALDPKEPAWGPAFRSDKADHGELNPRPQERVSCVHFQSDPKYYDRPALAPGEPHLGWGDRDAFDELAEPAAKAGIKLFARLCDWGNAFPFVPDMAAGWAIETLGNRRPHFVCCNNPDYRRWMRNLMEDLFRSHPQVAGLNYGFERCPPLIGVLNGRTDPDCFCEHCCALGERHGARPERAREGFRELVGAIAAIKEKRPADGAFPTIFRILRNFPEILTWDRLMVDGWLNMARDMYYTIKGVDANAEVGWHLVHHESHNPLFRVIFDTDEMGAYADFFKPVLYHNPTGMRHKHSVMEWLGSSIFADLPKPVLLEMSYAMCGLLGCDLPSWDEMQNEPVRSFTPEYVKRETERFVSKTDKPIYPGIGLDIPGKGGEECSPESVYACTKAAFDGGAHGVIISREYDEMQIKNLEAAGRAVKEVTG
ncbi:MAG: hypothetical protein ACFB21_03445 [Opitutales bacterium]